MVVLLTYGQPLLIKRNPWLSGKFQSYVRKGLAKVKKPFILANPPPWYDNPTALSPNQLQAVRAFTALNIAMRGKTMEERILAMKKYLKGQRYGRKERVRPEKWRGIATEDQIRELMKKYT